MDTPTISRLIVTLVMGDMFFLSWRVVHDGLLQPLDYWNILFRRQATIEDQSEDGGGVTIPIVDTSHFGALCHAGGGRDVVFSHGDAAHEKLSSHLHYPNVRSTERMPLTYSAKIVASHHGLSGRLESFYHAGEGRYICCCHDKLVAVFSRAITPMLCSADRSSSTYSCRRCHHSHHRHSRHLGTLCRVGGGRGVRCFHGEGVHKTFFSNLITRNLLPLT